MMINQGTRYSIRVYYKNKVRVVGLLPHEPNDNLQKGGITMAEIGANVAKQRILQTELKDFNKAMLESLFASYVDKPTNTPKDAAFKSYDKIHLTQAEYKYVGKDGIDTTLGLLYMNRYLLEYTGIIEHLGYWNIPLDSKGLSKLNVAVNNLVVTDIIDTKVLGHFIDRRDTLGFHCASFLSSSISPTLVRPMNDVKQLKLQLLEKYADELKSDDPARRLMASNAIEKELMVLVRKNLKGDYGYDMYASGDGNLDNNYKTINVMRGAVFNSLTGNFDVSEASLMDGISKKDIPSFANSVVAGAYPSAIGTADAGYMAKIILALLQSEHIDPDPNSDCGTQMTIPLTISDRNTQYVLFRNINVGGKTMMITPNNVNSLVGKTVHMYSPQCCTHESICGKCAGKIFHNLGATQIGLLVTSITQKLLNIKLKSKHDLSQKAAVIDKKHLFQDDNKFYDIEDGYIVTRTPMKIFIPRMFEEFKGFSLEATVASSFAVLPVKFYDNSGNEQLSTIMTVPTTLDFLIYDDIQEDPTSYILQYEAGAKVCSVAIRQSVKNVEFFMNQVYLYSKTAQLPYNMMTELMFRCLEINKIDLTGPSITYEIMARRVCRSGGHSFALKYGQGGVDPMSYDKEDFRTAVQRAGILQGLLFQDISTAINVGLAQTIDGVKPTTTPLEKVIKA